MEAQNLFGPSVQIQGQNEERKKGKGKRQEGIRGEGKWVYKLSIGGVWDGGPLEQERVEKLAMGKRGVGWWSRKVWRNWQWLSGVRVGGR